MNEDTNITTTVDTDNQEQQEQEVKTYTEEEVMNLLQQEADRRVSSALKKQRAKYEKELSLSKLDEQARGVAEKDMRIQELEEKLRDYQLLQNKSEIVKVLTARNLNPQFADLIEIGEDVKEAQSRIDTLDKLFKDAGAAEVKKRLASGTPKVGTGITADEMTPEKFKKLTLAQKSELYNTNPELFKKLSGN